jgi:hypothetical protein
MEVNRQFVSCHRPNSHPRGRRLPLDACPKRKQRHGGAASDRRGEPTVAGSAQYSAEGGIWTINGVGTDIWEASDQFNFAAPRVEGDATIIARLAKLTTDADGSRKPLSKCGVIPKVALAGLVVSSGSETRVCTATSSDLPIIGDGPAN